MSKSLSVKQCSILFHKLIKSPVLQLMFERDSCCALVDKYHLITVFLYFMRAKLKPQEYNLHNFFLALYISHEINEEMNFYKDLIVQCYLLTPDGQLSNEKQFQIDRFNLLIKMDFKALVNQRICKIFLSAVVPSRIWNRNKTGVHYGLFRCERICSQCKMVRISRVKNRKL